MSLSSETSLVQYAGNGSSVSGYAIPFKFLDNSHVKAVLRNADGVETELAETTHYTLTGAEEDGGGTLTTVTAYASTYTLTIYRELPFTQPTDYEAQGAFPAESHETALDRVTMLCQQLKRLADQAFKVSAASDFPSEINLSASADTFMGFDSAADFKLWTASALRELLSLEGTIESQVVATWADDAARAAKVPDYTSQVGVQTDDKSLWISTGASAGNWLLFALDEDNMATDSSRRPATQQSLVAYLTSVLSDAANLPDHASRHVKGGADELDGDTVDIDTTFTNFTPDTTPGTVADAAHLGAILKGMDNALLQGVIVLQDQKAQNTAGGSATSGSWETRTLNTKVIDSGNHCALSSNQFTLQPGRYVVYVSAPANGVQSHQARLYNVSGSSVAAIGSNAHSWYAYIHTTLSTILGFLDVSSVSTYRIEHRVTASRSNDGYGQPCNFGTEAYTTVLLIRLGNT